MNSSSLGIQDPNYWGPENFSCVGKIDEGVLQYKSNQDGKFYVLKRPLNSGEPLQRIQNERSILWGLEKSDKIIGLIRVLGMKKGEVEIPLLVFSFYPLGTIRGQIQENGAFTAEKTTLVFKQILEGLSFLKKHGIIHRDIKPENIIFSNEDEIKIIDFGIAMKKGEQPSLPFAGTLLYMSPERVDIIKTVNDFSGDVWAAGCVGAEMFFGNVLFNVDLKRTCATLDLMDLHEGGMDDPEKYFSQGFLERTKGAPEMSGEESVQSKAEEEASQQKLKGILTKALIYQYKERPSCEDLLTEMD